jgi:hypothetical protein
MEQIRRVMMEDRQEVVLRDVLDVSRPKLTVGLAVTTVSDGIVIFTNDINYRVVVENVEGKLMLHVWATADSIENDPTHSIEIEIATKMKGE